MYIITTSDAIKNFFKKFKISIIIPIIISIIALLISYKSYSLSSNQYNDSKTAIYRASVNSDMDSMSLIPYSNDIYLQIAEVYFPTKLSIDKEPFRVDNSDYNLQLTLFLTKLESILIEDLSPSSDYVNCIAFNVPMIISSNYIYNGVIYNGAGLYYLYFEATIDNIGKTKIYLKSIIYSKEIDKGINAFSFLDKEWEKSWNTFLNDCN